MNRQNTARFLGFLNSSSSIPGLIVCVLLAALIMTPNCLYAKKRPIIEIHPEIFLGLDKNKAQRPERKRLPWRLKLIIKAEDESGNLLAGPMSVTTTENVFGVQFTRAAALQTDKTPARTITEASATNSSGTAVSSSRTFTVPENASMVLEKMEFAGKIDAEGAYSIHVNGFVKLTLQTGDSSEEYQAKSTCECWPKKEYDFASFPGVIIKITARWQD